MTMGSSFNEIQRPSLDELWAQSLSIGGFYNRATGFYTRYEMEAFSNSKFVDSKKLLEAKKTIKEAEQELVVVSHPNGQYAVAFNKFFETEKSASEFICALLTLCPGLALFEPDEEPENAA